MGCFYYFLLKNTAKGIDRSEQIRLRHEIYNKVHSGESNQVKATCSNIRSIENNLYTMQMEKNALVKLDRKRYWDNREKSYGYGHPAAKIIDKPEIIIKQSGTKRKFDQNDDPKDVDLTLRKKKKVRNMFK